MVFFECSRGDVHPHLVSKGIKYQPRRMSKAEVQSKGFRNKTHILGHVLKTLNPSPAIRGGPYVVPPAEMVTATLFQRTCQRSNFKHYLGQKVNEALSCDIWRRFCAVLDHAIVVSSLHTCFPSLQKKQLIIHLAYQAINRSAES